MKRILKITTLAVVLMLFTTEKKASAQFNAGVSISYQTFYDELSPYGQWIDYPEYGYVWVPDAGPDFRPYSTNGHWVWTDQYGWMWTSNYDWGWAPFHYGRWHYDDWYGWVWVPGYEWSPAWVVWRHSPSYYGWAPMRPGININLFFSIGSYSPPYDYWVFAPTRYITHRNIYNYYVPHSQNITIINNTTIINNYNYQRNIFTTGPRRADAERYAGRISPVRFRESNRPGRTQFRNNEIVQYRPQVQRDDNRRFSPQRVERYEGGQASSGRNDRNDRRNMGPVTIDRNDNGQINRNRRFEQQNGQQQNRVDQQRQQQQNRVEQQRQQNDQRRFEQQGQQQKQNRVEQQRQQNDQRRFEQQRQQQQQNRVEQQRQQNDQRRFEQQRQQQQQNRVEQQRQQNDQRRFEQQRQQQQQNRVEQQRQQNDQRRFEQQRQQQQNRVEQQRQPQQRQVERQNNGNSNGGGNDNKGNNNRGGKKGG